MCTLNGEDNLVTRKSLIVFLGMHEGVTNEDLLVELERIVSQDDGSNQPELDLHGNVKQPELFLTA